MSFTRKRNSNEDQQNIGQGDLIEREIRLCERMTRQKYPDFGLSVEMFTLIARVGRITNKPHEAFYLLRDCELFDGEDLNVSLNFDSYEAGITAKKILGSAIGACFAGRTLSWDFKIMRNRPSCLKEQEHLTAKYRGTLVKPMLCNCYKCNPEARGKSMRQNRQETGATGVLKAYDVGQLG